MEKDVIFFDGVCNLCTYSVQWVIKKDIKNQYSFSSLQGELAAKSILSKLPKGTDSIVLLRNGKLYLKSSAVLRIAGKLGLPYNLSIIFLIVPPFIRDWIYGFVASRRYKWFGKKNECWLPSAELNSKFIS